MTPNTIAIIFGCFLMIGGGIIFLVSLWDNRNSF